MNGAALDRAKLSVPFNLPTTHFCRVPLSCWLGCCLQAGEAGAAQVPKVAAAFLKFLEEASVFYRRLVMQLQSCYGSVGVKLELPTGVTSKGSNQICSASRLT
jgi:hypothetical protein